METILYDDEHGTDLLIDNTHNVNLGWEHDSLSPMTHSTRDGKPMQVHFNALFGSYFVMVGR